MGNVPSAPDTNKTTENGQSKRCAYAVSSMRGWRENMEDAHAALPTLSEKDVNAFFGVWDGHADQGKISKHASEGVPEKMKTLPEYSSGNFPAALEKSFVTVDEELRVKNEANLDCGGATAISVLYTSDEVLYCANAGDSRCVLSSGGLATPLSTDHKPNLERENARIRAAGGFVTGDNRVNGLLAPSRAFGDFFYKDRTDLPPSEQMVTVVPEVSTHKMTKEDEFFVVACDGIWDVLSSQQVMDAVRLLASRRTPLGKICEQIMDLCVSPEFGGVGCDNMTIIIVAFLRGKSLDQWYDWISQRVKQSVGHATPDELPRKWTEEEQANARVTWEETLRARREAASKQTTHEENLYP